MSHKIIVTISKDGSSEVKVDGFKGKGCKDLTKSLEKALGSVKSDKETLDYYKKEDIVSKTKISGA